MAAEARGKASAAAVAEAAEEAAEQRQLNAALRAALEQAEAARDVAHARLRRSIELPQFQSCVAPRKAIVPGLAQALPPPPPPGGAEDADVPAGGRAYTGVT